MDLVKEHTRKLWLENNKDKRAEHQKKYWEANKQVLAQKAKERRELNKEKIKEQKAMYRAINKEAINEKSRLKYEEAVINDPEAMRAKKQQYYQNYKAKMLSNI